MHVAVHMKSWAVELAIVQSALLTRGCCSAHGHKDHACTACRLAPACKGLKERVGWQRSECSKHMDVWAEGDSGHYSCFALVNPGCRLLHGLQRCLVYACVLPEQSGTPSELCTCWMSKNAEYVIYVAGLQSTTFLCAATRHCCAVRELLSDCAADYT